VRSTAWNCWRHLLATWTRCQREAAAAASCISADILCRRAVLCWELHYHYSQEGVRWRSVPVSYLFTSHEQMDGQTCHNKYLTDNKNFKNCKLVYAHYLSETKIFIYHFVTILFWLRSTGANIITIDYGVEWTVTGRVGVVVVRSNTDSANSCEIIMSWWDLVMAAAAAVHYTDWPVSSAMSSSTSSAMSHTEAHWWSMHVTGRGRHPADWQSVLADHTQTDCDVTELLPARCWVRHECRQHSTAHHSTDWVTDWLSDDVDDVDDVTGGRSATFGVDSDWQDVSSGEAKQEQQQNWHG